MLFTTEICEPVQQFWRSLYCFGSISRPPRNKSIVQKSVSLHHRTLFKRERSPGKIEQNPVFDWSFNIGHGVRLLLLKRTKSVVFPPHFRCHKWVRRLHEATNISIHRCWLLSVLLPRVGTPLKHHIYISWAVVASVCGAGSGGFLTETRGVAVLCFHST